MRDEGPPAIRDTLLNPVAIYILAALLIPRAAMVLAQFLLPEAGPGFPQAVRDAAAVGVVLVAQGAALMAITLSHVTGPRGLGLPVRALGLSVEGWPARVRQGLAAGLALLAINMVGSRVAVLVFTALLGPEAVARHVARERAVTALFQLELPPAVLVLLFVGSVLIAPVSEELFFRGYVHGVLRARLGNGAAYASAAAFAAAHAYVVHFLPLFFIGFLLARLYERTGTLVAPMAAHAVVNLAVAVSLRL
ncbi:MAG TPA: CPBP family intramembrane glutamic endopeptidase [Limnochordales bacterium]